MIETLGEGVCLTRAEAGVLCSVSTEKFENEEYCVAIFAEGGEVAWVSLGSVDRLVGLLREVATSGSATDIPPWVTVSDDPDVVVCSRCDVAEDASVAVVSLNSYDHTINVCRECADDVADAVESVWECGVELGAGV